MLLTITSVVSLLLGTPSPSDPPPTDNSPASSMIEIFDGTSLQGWRGNPRFWTVEDGCIVGRSTAENPCKVTTYLHHDAVLENQEGQQRGPRAEGAGAVEGRRKQQAQERGVGPGINHM